jgi:hypothetical protein
MLTRQPGALTLRLRLFRLVPNNNEERPAAIWELTLHHIADAGAAPTSLNESALQELLFERLPIGRAADDRAPRRREEEVLM